MKKLTSLFFILSFCTVSGFAQSTVISVTLNKIPQPALKIDLPVDDGVSEDFFTASLKKSGYNDKMFSKSTKIDEGFYAIKGVRLQGTKEPVDLYVKIEQKGKKSNHESTICLLISKEGGFITSSSDAVSFAAAEKFLNAFADQAAAYQLKLMIEDQQDLVKDAEKKLDKLQDHQKDMEKKIENLQKDLKENREDQQAQEKSIDAEKKKLDDLKAQAKKYS